jgi:hypothetical protein
MKHLDWGVLKRKLMALYREWRIVGSFRSDEKYLRNAFNFTESLWFEQYKSINKIKLVMLSEAPLFGNSKKYFYNPEAKFSSFFYFNDLKALSDGQIQTQFSTHKEKKQYMLRSLNERGFLILDIFPFAFNPVNTKINYRNMGVKKYKKIFESTHPFYLSPKLKLIKIKRMAGIKFIFRYKRLMDRTGNFLERSLRENGLFKSNDELVSIHKQMMLNRKLLSDICKGNSS